MNKKRLAIMFATAATVVAPVASVIACSNTNDDGSKYFLEATQDEAVKQLEAETAQKDNADSTKIEVLVRNEEKPMWNEIAKKFNSFNRGVIDLEGTKGDTMAETLATRMASGNLPVLSLGHKVEDVKATGSYAEMLNLGDFLKNETKDVYNVDDGETNYTLKDFNQSHIDFLSNKQGMALGAPIGYSGKVPIMNSGLLDFTKELRTWGRNADGVLEAFGPAITGTGTDGAITIDDLDKFMADAGVKTTIDAAGEAHGWLGWGVGNMFQRMASIGLSLLSDEARKAGVKIMTFKETFSNFGMFASAPIDDIKDDTNSLLKEDFESKVLRGGKDGAINPKFTHYFWQSMGQYFNDVKDQDNLDQSTTTKADHSKEQPGFVTSEWLNRNSVLSKTGEVESLIHKQALFNFNAKWAMNWPNNEFKKHGGEDSNGEKQGDKGDHPGFLKNDADATDYSKSTVKDNALNRATASKFGVTSPNYQAQVGAYNPDITGLVSLASPYSVVGNADQLIIKKNASVKESLVAKRFIKFLYQTNSAYAVQKYYTTGDADLVKGVTISPLEGIAQSYVPSIASIADTLKAKEALGPAWFNLGNKTPGKAATSEASDIYNGVTGVVWQKQDIPFTNRLEKRIWPAMMKHHKSGGDVTAWTEEQFAQLMQDGITSYLNDAEVE